MKRYDVIVVLGSQPDTVNWEFPGFVYRCLDKAKILLENGQTEHIVTSGKWSLAIENMGLTQTFRECDKMAEYLQSKGVSEKKIIKEGASKDSISNLYYIKTEILIPNKFKSILFVTADFRIPKLKFLCDRIMGSDYNYDFEPIEAEPSESFNYNEPQAMKVQEEFLKPMKDGDHSWLDSKFYSAPMYKFWAKQDQNIRPNQQK